LLLNSDKDLIYLVPLVQGLEGDVGLVLNIDAQL